MSAQLTGTWQLVRLILRRDRVRLPLWLVGFGVLAGITAPVVKSTYDTPEQIAVYGATVEGSAAGRFLNGRPYDVDRLGGIVAYELSATATVIVSLMVIFLVVRHTRSEEESGRAELLRGGVLGRHAHTASAVVVASAASLVLGVIDAMLLTTAGLDLEGSVLHGASLVGLGLVFTGVAAFAAQLTASARAALGIGGGTLGVVFAIRGVGDVNETFWTWLSPLGWAQAIRPYGDRQWWPVLALLALSVVVAGATALLTAHRDQGAGLWQPRPGRPRARAVLGTTFGLALRLQRGLIIGWLVFLGSMSAIYGAFAREVEALVESNPEMMEAFLPPGGDVLDSFFALVIGLMAVLTSAFTLASALRLRSEEENGHAEAVLACAQSRLGWATGSLAVTVVATLLALTLVGFATGAAHALAAGDTTRMDSLIWAALGQAPAALVVGAVGVALHGWLPQRALLAWVVFAFAIVQSNLGDTLRLPDPIRALSPFWHLPQVPIDDFEVLPVAVLLALALSVAAVGLWRLRERDLITP